MCGIAGFVGNGTIEHLQQMTQKLIHRGPDAEGLWHDAQKGVYLGHRRLSIIDINDGKQPIMIMDVHSKFTVVKSCKVIVFMEKCIVFCQLLRLKSGQILLKYP